jgi:hypothetical protein
MPTKPQQARSSDRIASDAMTLIASGTPHHFRAGAALSIANVRIPRGAIIPPELVQAFDAERLHLMLRNRLIVVVLGPAPKAADERVTARLVEPPDPNAAAKEREAMIAAAKARGEPDWMWDAHAKVPAGAYAPAPPPAPERSWHDQSLDTNRSRAINGT